MAAPFFDNEGGLEVHAAAARLDFSTCLAATDDHRDGLTSELLQGQLCVLELIGIMIH